MDEEQRGGGAFGTYVRAQRRLARLSLRQLSELTQISNPYLSQIERGLHQPSVTVIKNLARALGVSVEALLAQAAGVGGQAADVGGQDGAPTDEPAGPPGVEEAVAADPGLDDTQKTALLAVYRSMVAAGEPSAPAPAQSPVACPAPPPAP
ncbi:MAG: helix-turn-helix domain-containing protein, partial [Acidimicrobiia bacterium]